MLNGSSLPSPQTEDSGTPDSIEDTSLPMTDIQFSQYSSEHFSSEPPRDDSIDASQCSTEHYGRAFPWDDSDSVSPHCSSRDIGSGPLSRDQHIEDAEVFLITIVPKHVQCSLSPTFLLRTYFSCPCVLLVFSG